MAYEVTLVEQGSSKDLFPRRFNYAREDLEYRSFVEEGDLNQEYQRETTVINKIRDERNSRTCELVQLVVSAPLSGLRCCRYFVFERRDDGGALGVLYDNATFAQLSLNIPFCARLVDYRGKIYLLGKNIFSRIAPAPTRDGPGCQLHPKGQDFPPHGDIIDLVVGLSAVVVDKTTEPETLIAVKEDRQIVRLGKISKRKGAEIIFRSERERNPTLPRDGPEPLTKMQYPYNTHNPPADFSIAVDATGNIWIPSVRYPQMGLEIFTPDFTPLCSTWDSTLKIIPETLLANEHSERRMYHVQKLLGVCSKDGEVYLRMLPTSMLKAASQAFTVYAGTLTRIGSQSAANNPATCPAPPAPEDFAEPEPLSSMEELD